MKIPFPLSKGQISQDLTRLYNKRLQFYTEREALQIQSIQGQETGSSLETHRGFCPKSKYYIYSRKKQGNKREILALRH